MENCDQTVMDLLAVTDIWNVPPILGEIARLEEHRQVEHGQD
jgi:hypothetical protein